MLDDFFCVGQQPRRILRTDAAQRPLQEMAATKLLASGWPGLQILGMIFGHHTMDPAFQAGYQANLATPAAKQGLVEWERCRQIAVRTPRFAALAGGNQLTSTFLGLDQVLHLSHLRTIGFAPRWGFWHDPPTRTHRTFQHAGS